jgi:hypothetical protein
MGKIRKRYKCTCSALQCFLFPTDIWQCRWFRDGCAMNAHPAKAGSKLTRAVASQTMLQGSANCVSLCIAIYGGKSMLELHAKVYFSAPSYNGTGDEFYFDVPPPNGSLVNSVGVRSTSWTVKPGDPKEFSNVIYDVTPLGGTAEIGVVLVYHGNAPELRDATLVLGTSISWWVSFPSGNYGTTQWSTDLTGATNDCQIMRVTV